MAWLVRDGDVLAAVDLDARGVASLRNVEGALLIRRRLLMIQTLTNGMAVDVAFCDKDLTVLSTVCLGRRRLARPRIGAAAVVAREGAFERWGLVTGDKLEVKGG